MNISLSSLARQLLGAPANPRPADWGTVRLVTGEWWSHRVYYRATSEMVGGIYDINTPVEVYPDAEILTRRVQQTLVGPALARRAFDEAHRLLSDLGADSTPGGLNCRRQGHKPP